MYLLPARSHIRRLAGSVAIVVAVLLVPGVFGQPNSDGASHASSKVGYPVNSSSLLPAALQYPFAERAGFDAIAASEVSSPALYQGNVTIILTLWPRSLSFFEPRLPGAPILTSLGIRSVYGLGDAPNSALVAYFVQHGLILTNESIDRLSLTLHGPARSADSAFRTIVVTGIHNGKAVEFPSTAPSLPPPFEAEVSSVVGLQEGFTTFSLPFSSVPIYPKNADFAIGPLQLRGSLVTPSIVHTIYGLDGLYNFSGTSHWATGVGIALLLWGQGYSPTDLSTFFSTYYPSSFPLPVLNAFPVSGAPPPSSSAINDPSNAPRELTLDMEWAGSEAPGATLDAVYAPDGPAPDYSPSDAAMEVALDTAVNQIAGVEIVSMSFGTNDGGDMGFQAAYSTYFSEANAKGITLVAASGDDGGTASPGCRGAAATEFPASSPDVLAVGGTAPVFSYNALGQFTGVSSEPAWNDSTGGFSSVYSAPSWQEVGSAAGPITSNGARGIPDVAAAASYNFLYFASAPAAGAGTSFGSPLWAGIIGEMDALRGSPFGFVTPRLYAIGAAQEAGTDALGLVDVTSGTNCVATASTGWDTVTGWGTPRGLLLYEDLTGTFVDLPLSVSPSSVPPGGAVDISVLVQNGTSHQPIAGVPVFLTLAADGYSGPCGGTFDSTNQNTSTSGAVTGHLTVPSCYIGGKAAVTATVSAAGFFGSNTTSVAVNLLGLAGFLAVVQQFPYNVITFTLIILVAVALGVWIGNRRLRRSVPSAIPPSVHSPPPPPSGLSPVPNTAAPAASRSSAPPQR